MLYYKICDNIADERGLKKIGYCLLKPIFSAAHKKAAREYPQIESAVSDYISTQNTIQNENCTSLDVAADPTALVMSKILPLCSDDATARRVLERLGYCLGRYIYLLDAACDLREDIKKGSYNVLKYELKGEPTAFARERVEPQLYMCANESAKAFELLPIKKFKPILGNIIYLGLEETFKKELNK